MRSTYRIPDPSPISGAEREKGRKKETAGEDAPSPRGPHRLVLGESGTSDPYQLPVLVRVFALRAVVCAQPLALDVDVREGAVEPLREPPGLLAQEGEDGRDDGHADDERVEEDGDREA